jgi:hypothetical protein
MGATISLQDRHRERQTAASPKLCSEKQEGRFLLLQCHAPPHSSTLVRCYKRPLKEEEGLLPFGALLWAFGFLLCGGCFLPLNIGKMLFLWAFWCGKLLEGKRIIDGEKLLKGEELLKGKC